LVSLLERQKEAHFAVWTPGEGLRLPDQGKAYQDGSDLAQHAFQRWVLVTPLDLVIVANGSCDEALLSFLSGQGLKVVPYPLGGKDLPLREILGFLSSTGLSSNKVSERLRIPPLDLAKDLSRTYGKTMRSVSYIPALAMMAQMELEDLGVNPDGKNRVMDALAEFYNGDVAPMGKRVNASAMAGHLLFADLYRRTGDTRWRELLVRAASLGFKVDGSLMEAMPGNNEMSDSFFMAGPILVEAGLLTGDSRYLSMARKHVQFMLDRCLRPDGIYRHSPLDQGAWGRGNGFPALGLTLMISSLPAEDPDRAFYLDHWERHLEALLHYQSDTGEWRQLVDREDSYREFSSTCMIGFSMARGVRLGLLSKGKFSPAIDLAWASVKRRTIGNFFVDVCTGTGKQKSSGAYYNREAIMGKDDRAGAMAMNFAVEMHRLMIGE